jgi:hypothetical protein
MPTYDTFTGLPAVIETLLALGLVGVFLLYCLIDSNEKL